MHIRTARAEDAAALCDVLRRSIEALCGEDHGGDPDALQQWLANKTHHNVLAWIEDPAQRFIIAEEHGAVLGGGAATATGEITLNYVSPDARFRGVSKTILRQLEAYVSANGHACAKLSSTRTAHRFYRAAGYADTGPPRSWGRLSEQPMAKRL